MKQEIGNEHSDYVNVRNEVFLAKEVELYVYGQLYVEY